MMFGIISMDMNEDMKKFCDLNFYLMAKNECGEDG